MIYYRVKKKYDGAHTCSGKVLISNELLTPTEYKKMDVHPDCIETVEVSRKRTYMSFGARFEIGTDHNS